MAGVEHGSLALGCFGNAVCYQMVGEFNVPDSGNVFVSHLFRQESNGSGRRFCLGAAAGERGIVIQLIAVGKIQKREPVAKDDGAMGQTLEKCLKNCLYGQRLGLTNRLRTWMAVNANGI